VNVTNGENRDTKNGLYNIMPLNVTLGIEHSLGNWSNSLEWQWVDDKDDVSDVRNELETDAYSLLDFRSSYEWKRVRVDFGIENIFDKFYAHPLGGAYVGEGNVMSGGATWGIPVPAMGRSVFTGVTMKF
jgi:iron complex outermembrane receptor protein